MMEDRKLLDLAEFLGKQQLKLHQISHKKIEADEFAEL